LTQEKLSALELYKTELRILKWERELLSQREDLAFQRYLERCIEEKKDKSKADLH